MNLEEVKAQAKKELQEELFAEAVAKEKLRLRTKKSFWDKIFRYRIVFIKKGE